MDAEGEEGQDDLEAGRLETEQKIAKRQEQKGELDRINRIYRMGQDIVNDV